MTKPNSKILSSKRWSVFRGPEYISGEDRSLNNLSYRSSRPSHSSSIHFAALSAFIFFFHAYFTFYIPDVRGSYSREKIARMSRERVTRPAIFCDESVDKNCADSATGLDSLHFNARTTESRHLFRSILPRVKKKI
ncbi:hypothetical protein PUN28_004888 [Cardiocondyla obscurior]|uniref:Transmembrane protein n=1 Tax=Cardiocondyla obscurior TaxID=286306 RepID=A0AAW2GES9_9HYME